MFGVEEYKGLITFFVIFPVLITAQFLRVRNEKMSLFPEFNSLKDIFKYMRRFFGSVSY